MIQHVQRNDEASSTSKESKLPSIQRLRIEIPANKYFMYVLLGRCSVMNAWVKKSLLLHEKVNFALIIHI